MKGKTISPKWSKWRELGLVCLCYALALFPPFIFEWLEDYRGIYFLYSNRNSYGIDTASIILLTSIALACLTQYLRRWERTAFSFLILLLSGFGIAATGHIFLYDAPISVGAIDALLGSDLHEALEYATLQFNPKMALLLSVYLVLVLVALFLIRPRLQPERPCPLAHGFAYCVFLILVILVYQYPGIAVNNRAAKEMQTLLSRIAILNAQVPSLRIMEDINQWLEYREWLKKNEDKRGLYDFNASIKNTQPHLVVLVIGESMRRDKLSLYGYDKKTTPKLDEMRHDLLIFQQAIAPANQTVPSVTKILSQANVLEPDKYLFQPSIITAARESGYKTYWLSNQGRVGQFDSMISLFAHESDNAIFTNTEFYGSIYDEALLKPLSIILGDTSPLKFIIIHLQGSHQNYNKRYTDDYNIFNASHYHQSGFDEEKRKILAEYDNSILHTDAVLDAIFNLVRPNANSTILYLSDHGERFYENGVDSCGHGYPNPDKSEVDVPFFLWCKNGCRQEWLSAFSLHENTLFSTENLFYTMANILDISMKDYDSTKDILSTDYLFTEPLVITTEKKVLSYSQLP